MSIKSIKSIVTVVTSVVSTAVIAGISIAPAPVSAETVGSPEWECQQLGLDCSNNNLTQNPVPTTQNGGIQQGDCIAVGGTWDPVNQKCSIN